MKHLNTTTILCFDYCWDRTGIWELEEQEVHCGMKKWI